MAVNDFLATYKITIGNKDKPNVILHHTFENEKSNRYSTIDFICLSDSLLNCVSSYDVICDATNHSDHLPVAVEINIPGNLDFYHYVTTGSVDEKLCTAKCHDSTEQPPLRWDKGNTDLYYSMTGQTIYPIYNELMYYVNGNLIMPNELINKLYSSAIDAMIQSSAACICRIPKNSLKFWWSCDLNKLKEKSITSHRIWIDAGRPKTGHIFDIKSKDKYSYKLLLERLKMIIAMLFQMNYMNPCCLKLLNVSGKRGKTKYAIQLRKT